MITYVDTIKLTHVETVTLKHGDTVTLTQVDTVKLKHVFEHIIRKKIEVSLEKLPVEKRAMSMSV